jgi:hypothetical protein
MQRSDLKRSDEATAMDRNLCGSREGVDRTKDVGTLTGMLANLIPVNIIIFIIRVNRVLET